MVRRCVWSKYLVNEEALAQWGGGLLCQKQTNNKILKYLDLEQMGCELDSSSQGYRTEVEISNIVMNLRVPWNEGISCLAEQLLKLCSDPCG